MYILISLLSYSALFCKVGIREMSHAHGNLPYPVNFYTIILQQFVRKNQIHQNPFSVFLHFLESYFVLIYLCSHLFSLNKAKRYFPRRLHSCVIRQTGTKPWEVAQLSGILSRLARKPIEMRLFLGNRL